MERIDRPGEGARWSRRERSPAGRLRLGLAGVLAPFEEESLYPGIGVADRRLAADFAPRLLVAFAVVLCAVSFCSFSLERFAAFQQPAFDAGLFDQGVWLLSRFKSPFVTLMGLNLFGDHSSYVMLLFVPLYWISASVQWLFVVQAFGLALGAIPVYLLGRRFLHNSWLAALAAFALLLTPALGWLNLENFHPDSLEVPLALFAFYFLHERRWRPYFVMIALLLLIKEDVAFLVVPLGIYAALRHDRRIGLLTVEAGIAWFLLTMFLLQPHFSGDAAGSLDAFRIPYGGWRGLISAALSRPWDVLSGLLTSDKIKYLVQLLAPVAFLPLLSVESLVVLPTLLFNLLSTFSYQHEIRYHYTSLIIPVFLWTALLFTRRTKTRGAQRALVVFMVLAAVFSAYLWGPADWSRQAPGHYDPQHAEVRAIAEAVALIPDDAVVAARSRVSTHLAHREKLYDFPTPFYSIYYGDGSLDHQRLPEADEVEYVLDIPARLSGEGARIFQSLQKDEGFRAIFQKEGVVLLRKEPASAAGLVDRAPGAPVYN